ncbi:unnamed protein product [Cuscuta epithymum]|uniref:Uncharacterized protein n=1 Tax=Cuscuta epithymum TaxID=186058 RepID=A0AAV0EG09_9ASTE|nr:unnamed protein product [Cuscuta epithymum]
MSTTSAAVTLNTPIPASQLLTSTPTTSATSTSIPTISDPPPLPPYTSIAKASQAVSYPSMLGDGDQNKGKEGLRVEKTKKETRKKKKEKEKKNGDRKKKGIWICRREEEKTQV